MTPTMKQGLYNVYLLLGSEEDLVTIRVATCECAAGYVCNYDVLLQSRLKHHETGLDLESALLYKLIKGYGYVRVYPVNTALLTTRTYHVQWNPQMWEQSVQVS